MMRTLLLLGALSQVLSCTVIGSKSALDVEPTNEWKKQHDEYVFSGNDIIVSIAEIVISEHTSAIGPIIPIVPLDHDYSHESKNLELRISIIGYPSMTELDLDTVSIEAYSPDGSVSLLGSGASVVSQTNKNNPEGKLWVQYAMRFSYGIRLGELEQLSIRFTLPMFETKVPELRLSRKEGRANRFILSPGV